MHYSYLVASSPGSHITEKQERRDSEIYGGGKERRAGKRAWYTLIHAWADFLGISRNRYSSRKHPLFFTSSHACIDLLKDLCHTPVHGVTVFQHPVQMAEATRTDDESLGTRLSYLATILACNEILIVEDKPGPGS